MAPSIIWRRQIDQLTPKKCKPNVKQSNEIITDVGTVQSAVTHSVPELATPVAWVADNEYTACQHSSYCGFCPLNIFLIQPIRTRVNHSDVNVSFILVYNVTYRH